MAVWHEITGWQTSDKIAALALCVAVVALLISLVPATTSVVEMIIALSAHRSAREALEPAVNASLMVNHSWPLEFIEVRLTVTNRSDFYIDVHSASLRAPRHITMAHMPRESAFHPPPPAALDPRAHSFSRRVDLGKTLIREVGATRSGPPPSAPVADNMREFRLALKIPPGSRRNLRTTFYVYISRAQRYSRKTTKIPVYVDIEDWIWQVDRGA